MTLAFKRCNMRTLRNLCLILVLIISTSLNASAQTKRALVIGVGTQLDSSWGKINGDKDIPLILSLLISSGYNKENIVTLVNSQATKDNIVNAFRRLTKVCKQNDVIYIHYSGHGQRVSDIDGDEKDGWDESWIPYDAYKSYCEFDKGDKHLIDDEVYTYLMAIKNKIGEEGKILVTVDACHSGDSAYGINSFNSCKEYVIRGVADAFIIPYKTFSFAVKSPERWLTLSACKSYQYNQEMKNPRVGILTYALYSLARKGSIGMDQIEEFIRRNKGPLPQTPTLTGEISKYSISDILK